MEVSKEVRTDLEKLDGKDLRLISICALVAAVSLFVGVRYFFKAFPEAQIEFKTPSRRRFRRGGFLADLKLPTEGYRHASIFGFDDDAKTFLERELGAEESASSAGRPRSGLWRWQHRWFRPLQKEELQVDVTTRARSRRSATCSRKRARAPRSRRRTRAHRRAFLTDVMHRRLEELASSRRPSSSARHGRITTSPGS
jgi:hypothetical protein